MSVLLALILLLDSPAQSQTQQKYARNSNGDPSIDFDIIVLLSIQEIFFFFWTDVCLILKRDFGDIWFFFFSKPKENTLVHPFPRIFKVTLIWDYLQPGKQWEVSSQTFTSITEGPAHVCGPSPPKNFHSENISSLLEAEMAFLVGREPWSSSLRSFLPPSLPSFLLSLSPFLPPLFCFNLAANGSAIRLFYLKNNFSHYNI